MGQVSEVQTSSSGFRVKAPWYSFPKLSKVVVVCYGYEGVGLLTIPTFSPTPLDRFSVVVEGSWGVSCGGGAYGASML